MKIPLFGLIAALIVRVFISAVTYHPDIKSQHFHAQYLGKGVVNIYEFVSDNKNSLPYKDTFNYPPTTYLFLGSWNFLAEKLMGPEINIWVNDWNTSTFFNSNISAYLLIFKAPYFVIDLMLLYLLMFLVPKTSRNKLFNLWAFNPISLYAVYSIGQFDIIPAFLTLVASIGFLKKKYLLVGIFLGLAMSLKTYPVLMLPIFILYSKSIKSSIKICLSMVLVYLLTIAPYLGSPEFVNSVFRSSLGSKLFEYSISYSSFRIPIYIIFYGIFLSWVIISKKTLKNFYKQLFTITFSFLIFTTYHPQWIIWSFPFLILVYLNRIISTLSLFLLLSLYLAIFLLIPDLYLSIGILSVLNPNVITMPAFAGFIPRVQEIKILLKIIFGSIFIHSIIRKRE